MLSKVSQGFSSNCLWPSANLLLSTSSSKTTTSSSSPTFTYSDGCLIFLVQDKSETCTRPSMPSSNSRNKPKLVRFLTTPLCLLPTEYLVPMSSLVHGSSVSCLIPKDIFLSSLSNVNTTASISSPTFTKSAGFLKCCDHDISDTWIKPSTPGASSRNAP